MEHISVECNCSGKECTKCKKLLCIGIFSKDKRLKSGLKSKCQNCNNGECKEWRQKNREYDSERQKRYRHENIEKVTQREKEYKHTNRARARELARVRRLRNPIPSREHSRRYARTHRRQMAERSKQYRLKNPERVKQREKKRYWANREERLAQNKQWRSSPQYREWWAQYYAQKGEERRYRFRKYYHTNRERMGMRVVDWYHANPRRRAIHTATRRTRKTQAGGSYTVAEWQTLKAKYDHTCLRCKRREPEIKLTADHVIPVALLGSSNIENIQPLCGSCNSWKKDKIYDFRMKRY